MEWEEEEEVRRGTCAGSEVAAVPFCPHVNYCICKPDATAQCSWWFHTCYLFFPVFCRCSNC